MKSIKKFFYAALITAGLATSFVACVDNDFDQPEIMVPEYEGTSNTAIADLKAKHTNGEFETIEEDLVIEGYVVSDDTEGNFYKQIIVQDSREGATGGIEVKINEKGLSSMMKPGQQVFIKAKGLVLGDYNGLVQLGGGTFQNGKYTNLAGIDPGLIKDHIFLNGLPVELQPKEVSLEELKDNDLYNSLVSTLVKITAAQFEDADGTLTYAEKDKSSNRDIVGPKGNKLIVRNSGYSNFYDEVLPQGSGTIVGVLSKFGSDKQMMIRSTEDVVMTGERFGDAPVDVPTPNATVADVKAKFTGDVLTITDDLIFDAIVISNEGTSSNFYNKVIVQDETAGIEIKAYKSDYLKALVPGQKVVVKAKDLLIGKYGESVQIGVEFNGGVGGMGDADAQAHVIKDEGGAEPTPSVLALDALDINKVNTLVKIENVQFKDSELSKTYAAPDGDFKKSENRYLTDAAGNEIILRTSNTANFAGETVAQKSGSIVGILSKFNDDWQLYIRSTADVTMEADRFEVTTPETPFVDLTLTELVEGFNNVTAKEAITLDGWFSEAIKGDLKWQGGEFSGEKFIGISGYNSDLDEIESWIVTPGLNLDGAAKKNFTFESQAGYSKAETLEVFISSNFDYNAGVAAATWTKLTVTLADASASGYGTFTTAGEIDLSAYSGKVHIAFKYVGNQSDATGTWRIDNVKFNYTPDDGTGGEEPASFDNWGAEKWTDDTTPEGFKKAENVSKESSIKHGGDFSIKHTSSSKTKDIMFETPVEVGATYEISFWYLDNDENAKGRIWSSFVGTADTEYKALLQPSTYLEAGSDWKQFKVEVVVPAGTTMLNFEVRSYKGESGNAGGAVYYDDFSVVKK
ncbi:DUF5689 domain-containing protein [Marinifilum flexuosum]|uniref:DUF5689 domain-containing protein n=1 Tax=Marinifilum flexuosum TaxID=1117708 RepID=UPI00249419B8|nr:DUF5689 domain-containing protein [Marinifilum flexuosum]